MVKYKKTFLDEIQVLFFYFMEFSKDGSILPKNYFKDCVIGGYNKKLIIIIIYNENIFLTNNK